jgi:hypothetical protein
MGALRQGRVQPGRARINPLSQAPARALASREIRCRRAAAALGSGHWGRDPLRAKASSLTDRRPRWAKTKAAEESEESEEEASFEECLEEAETQGGASASTGPTVAETNQSPAARGTLTAAQLAAAPPAMQKQLLGAKLFPAVFRIHPHLEAADIAGMLLKMDNGELLQLLEPGPQLEILVGEALLGLVTYPPDPPGEVTAEGEASAAQGHTDEVTTQGQAGPDPSDLDDAHWAAWFEESCPPKPEIQEDEDTPKMCPPYLASTRDR